MAATLIGQVILAWEVQAGGASLVHFPYSGILPNPAGAEDAGGVGGDLHVLFTVVALPEEQAPPTHILGVTICNFSRVKGRKDTVSAVGAEGIRR